MLCENVVLSSTRGFHSFFMCDEEDFTDSQSLDLDVKERTMPVTPWRDLPESASRRRDDWTNVSLKPDGNIKATQLLTKYPLL